MIPKFYRFVLLSLLIGSPAWAQIPDDDTIIVKGIYDGERNLNQIAASVDVLNHDVLETIALIHPAEALNGIAGVNIHRGSGQEHLTAIRSPVLTGGAGAGSFLYLEDGVPLRAAGFANVNGLFEAGTEFAGSLEVFKGPGPALYGSNAVHGLINVQSASVAISNNMTVLGSEDGLISAKASMGLSHNLRASASVVSDSGFRDDSGFDQQKFQLKYENDLGLWRVEGLSSFNNLNQETASFVQGDKAYLNDDIRFTNPNPEAFRDGKSYRVQARFEREFGDKTLALTPFARRAELRFLRHFVPGQALEENEHSSLGLQSAWYGEGLNIGADIEYTKGSLFEFQENPNRFSFVQGLHYDYAVKSVVVAAYVQNEFKIGDKLSLDLGARAEFTNYDYDNKASDGVSGRFIRTPDRSDDFLTITPKATLRYDMNSQTNFYLRAVRGARAPQVTDLYSVQLSQVAGEADVETLDSVEAGVKTGLGLFDIELATYQQWKDNFFFRNANGFNVVNGKTKHSGVEFSFNGSLTPWLDISGDGTLAKHSYNFTEITGSAANNITKGDRVDTAPDSLAHMRVTVKPNSDWRAELEWRHVGKYFTNPGNTARYPGHDIFVLRSNYAFSEKLNVFGRIDNLFDKRYADRADFAFGNERYFPGRPRTVFLGLSSDF